MKPNTLALLTAAFILHPSSFLLSQALLTPPPGAPAPTMKTLDHVEARTPIGSAPFGIATRGSYYLTENLTVASGNAIIISADDVTLDLNGFTISSTASPASGTAVAFSGARQNVFIHNGQIRGTTTVVGSVFTTGGFLSGIHNSVGGSANLRLADVSVLRVGLHGINLGNIASVTVQRCTVNVCAGIGIAGSVVEGCSVEAAGGIGILGDAVALCFARSVGTDAGDNAIDGNQIENCRGTANAGRGITGAAVSNSLGSSSSNVGVVAVVATNCFGASTTGAFGMDVAGTASYCRGQRTGGVAINAGIAIGCTVGSGTVTTPAGGKFLGTP